MVFFLILHLGALIDLSGSISPCLIHFPFAGNDHSRTRSTLEVVAEQVADGVIILENSKLDQDLQSPDTDRNLFPKNKESSDFNTLLHYTLVVTKLLA